MLTIILPQLVPSSGVQWRRDGGCKTFGDHQKNIWSSPAIIKFRVKLDLKLSNDVVFSIVNNTVRSNPICKRSTFTRNLIKNEKEMKEYIKRERSVLSTFFCLAIISTDLGKRETNAGHKTWMANWLQAKSHLAVDEQNTLEQRPN